MRREHAKSQGGVLPAGYTQLEYIEGTGTQYIDTGLIAPDGFHVTARWMWTSIQEMRYIVGSHNISNPYGRNGVQSSRKNGVDGYWGMGTGNTYPISSTKYTAGVIYDIEGQTIKGNSWLKVNDSTVVQTTDNSTRSSNSILIFTEQYSVNAGAEKSKARMYDSMTITIDSTDYVLIPTLRTSDNKPGVYNVTNQTFHTNAGTGEFLYA